MKLEAAAKAAAYFREAKRKIKIIEEEEFEKLRLLVSSDELTLGITKDMFIHMKAVAKNSMKNARDTLRHPEGLGAIRRSHSKPRHPDLKVKFAGDPAGDNAAPSAPSKEDLVDANDGPPKYESLQKKSEHLRVSCRPLGALVTTYQHNNCRCTHGNNKEERSSTQNIL